MPEHSSLVRMRERADATSNRIFKEATTLAKHGGDFELKQPMLNARQVHRAVQSAEQYFRITLYNEFLSLNLKKDSLVLTL